jgi:hypothetical protein
MAKRQPELPGTERESIPELDDATECYLAAREQTAGMREAERLALDALLARMAERELERYAYVDGDFLFVVRATQEPKIKITKIKAEVDAPSEF